jgi:hypothetical protein
MRMPSCARGSRSHDGKRNSASRLGASRPVKDSNFMLFSLVSRLSQPLRLLEQIYRMVGKFALASLSAKRPRFRTTRREASREHQKRREMLLRPLEADVVRHNRSRSHR